MAFPSLLAFSALTIAFVISNAATAQEGGADDDEEDAAPEDRFEIPESSFESWVFGHRQSSAMARAKLETQLELLVADVERAGQLTDAQRRKIRLAGSGDIKRYFDGVELVRRKFLSIRKDRDRFGEIWMAIQPIQQQLAAGVYGGKSFFRKSLPRVLGNDHAARYEAIEKDRRAYQYRAKVEWVVAMLENVLPLREEQRPALIRLIIEKTRPPKISSEHDHYVILWQLSKLPETVLKPVFDESQWKALNQQFTQSSGIERHLEANGRLVLEGDPDPADVAEPELATESDGKEST